MSDITRAREALLKHFGFTDFREGQAEVIEAVLNGENSVVVMPTGGGKSLCFQLPALMLDGVTLVVSPLIALMKDQVDQLASRGIPTTFINSSLSYSEVSRRLSEIRRGLHKLVYIAPERFRSEAFTETIAEVKVRLFAIDEAHCISHWGHDFRPDYLRLKEAAERLGSPQVIALTATATPQVRADISEQLGLVDPRVFVAGFDRPNLALRVLHVGTEKEKIATLKNLIQRSTGSGIIYAATRKSVEQVTAKLKLAGLSVEAYHGGMDEGERTRAQESFMRGDSKAIVATNAFGMGIDKPDIRFVAHFHLPGSIEAYYQEVGRAGRDGLDADCVMLFNYADTRTQQFFIEGSHPPPDLIGRVYFEVARAGEGRTEKTARDIAERLKIKNEMSVYSSLVLLEKAGHIERGRTTDTVLLATLKSGIDTALGAVPDDSIEGAIVRDLVFNRNVTEREPSELDVSVIAAGLGINEGQVRRGMASLAERGLIDCRTAFQGRGIRLLDEEPARALRIDTKELAARAAAEQWKLRRMIDYCYHKERGCLRRFILNYFGDRKHLANCGTCSYCAPDADSAIAGARTDAKVASGTLTVGRSAPASKMAEATQIDRFIIEQAPTGRELRSDLRKKAEAARATSKSEAREVATPAAARALSEGEALVVVKILSCVARLKSRFGKGTVAAVLRGSTAKQVLDHDLDKLSTYGLLREMTQDEITLFIKALIQADCISVDKGAYPTVSLTDFGREVMLGRAEVMLEMPS
ncbi:MAG TPA: RecQ family ATP-dependent DNA helicase [Blastocatellia bacterium]|nr:RecQ family ATP-dependent DNA helicase [Blastocatellia bacterium]